MTEMIIRKPGLFTTLQDSGRWGMQRYGVSPGGAMDFVSSRLANWLVGNRGEEAAMEITMLGPTLEITGDARLAVCGANMRPRIGNAPLPLNRPVDVPGGSVIEFGAAINGCRAYLALAGGFDGQRALGQRLASGDRLPLRAARSRTLPSENHAPFLAPPWSVRSDGIPARFDTNIVRALEGPEFNRLSGESKKALFAEAFAVTAESNRMGYRLQGAKLALDRTDEMLSEPVATGTVQLPAGGDPIVLMADRQTTGGYPRILQVISADLPLLAQSAPGMKIVFERTSLGEALIALKEQNRRLQQICSAIRMNTRRSER